MVKEGGAALRHESWKARRRLDAAAYGVELHDLLSKVLGTMGSFDQLNLGNVCPSRVARR